MEQLRKSKLHVHVRFLEIIWIFLNRFCVNILCAKFGKICSTFAGVMSNRWFLLNMSHCVGGGLKWPKSKTRYVTNHS